MLLCSALSLDASLILELRGVLQTPNGEWKFSIHEPESGKAVWLWMNQERNGYQVTNYNPNTKTIDLLINGQSSYLALVDSDNIPLQVLFSADTLTNYNRELLKHHKQLIKYSNAATNNSTAGIAMRKEALSKAKQLKDLLITNPSVQNVNQLIGELGESIDYAALMQIDPGPIITSRNEQNTAGWGIKKDVDHEKLAEILATNPSLKAIHEIVLAE
ncbi:MAG TPA: hypothetical protein DCX06_00855 [Opitutae bacterium]|nr:hypothetical protein [Opitutae bacterium]